MPIPPLQQTPQRHYGDISGQNNTPRRPKRRLPWNFIKFTAKAAVGGAILLFVFGSIFVIWASKDLPNPNNLQNRQVAQSTKIYDRTGEHLIYETIFQDQRRTVVTLEQMSPWLPKAVVAIEDKYFYEHNGIRWISVARAMFNNLIRRSTGAGGASTITQQLIKNTMIGNKPSLFEKVSRKLKEFILAPQLEKRYSKDEIIQMYLNEIPLGGTNYGIESASQSYFGKKAQELTLAESATVAAMIQAPSRYLNRLQNLHDRRNYVLKLMQDQGMITAEQAEAAKKETSDPVRKLMLSEAPHFINYILKQLQDKYGDLSVETAGLKVITTLDYDKQMIAEATIKELGDKFAKESNANNSAMVALDPKTAQILALVGSRDYNSTTTDGNFDVVTQGYRQPGSSFKPFVYTAAFEKGYTPETVIYDVKTNFDLRGGDAKYIPQNYDGKDHGLITIRKALQGSLNIPAVKTMYLVGNQQTVEFAKRFGYTSFTKEPDLTMVLGGTEVNLLEHTNAYATLANNGIYHTPVSILKVTDNNGEVIDEWKPDDGSEAVKPELAALITDVLTDNNARAYIFGLNNSLVLPGSRPVAAKTGTTNDNKDAWTLGYTPSITTGVWVGNTPIASPMKAGGNALAGKIWNRFMSEALKNTPVETFPTPPPNDAEKPVLRGADGGIKLRINQITGRIASSSTPDSMVIEKIYLPPHDILFYVNKDDPRGPALANPADDPQYQNWENALLEWVEREKAAGREVSFEETPSAYDSETAPELAPTIQIIFPNNNETITNRQITITTNASAPRGVVQVVFYLDDQKIGSANQTPFNLNINLRETINGSHTIKVVAMDDQGNNTAQYTQINLQAEMEPASSSWFDSSPLSLTTADFPRAMYLVPFRWLDTKEVRILLDNKLIYTFDKTDELSNQKLMLTWKHTPTIGGHTLSAVTIDNTGRTIQKDLVVEVR